MRRRKSYIQSVTPTLPVLSNATSSEPSYKHACMGSKLTSGTIQWKNLPCALAADSARICRYALMTLLESEFCHIVTLPTGRSKLYKQHRDPTVIGLDTNKSRPAPVRVDSWMRVRMVITKRSLERLAKGLGLIRPNKKMRRFRTVISTKKGKCGVHKRQLRADRVFWARGSIAPRSDENSLERATQFPIDAKHKSRRIWRSMIHARHARLKVKSTPR